MLKVFMAEDDSLLVRVYERIFKSGGYEVVFATDGEEAIHVLKTMEIKPSIIFLDVLMPKKDGFDVMEDIKKDSVLKNIPVIFLTNIYQPADEKRGKDLGAVEYMVKSQYIPSEIVNKVKSLCDKYCK